MKRSGGILLKLVFSCAITVLGLEAALWLLHPLSVFPDQWSCRYKQSLPGLKSEVLYARNLYGFRSLTGDSARTKEKARNTIRVLCLGASTTDLPTQNAADAWWGVLERRLNETFQASGRRVEVWARGRGGETVFRVCVRKVT